jgi:hypothetical protein
MHGETVKFILRLLKKKKCWESNIERERNSRLGNIVRNMLILFAFVSKVLFYFLCAVTLLWNMGMGLCPSRCWRNKTWIYNIPILSLLRNLTIPTNAQVLKRTHTHTLYHIKICDKFCVQVLILILVHCWHWLLNKMTVLKNRVLRKAFGSKRQKETGDCIMRFPHLYHTVDYIYIYIRMRWMGHVARKR